MTLSIFSRLLAVAALSWRKVYLSPLPIWESSCLFFVVDLEFFMYSGYWSLIRFANINIFSHYESGSHSVRSYSLQPHGLYSPWNSPGQNTGVGSLSLLQGIFPTQRSNPGLPHCRWILYQLSLSFYSQWCPLMYKRFKFWWSLFYLFIFLLPLLLVSYPRNHHQIQSYEGILLCFVLKVLWFYLLSLVLWSFG